MDEETIVFLRALCAKAKEVANLCDSYLELKARNNKKSAIPTQTQINSNGSIGNRLIPINKWPEFHSWPTVGSLRHYIFMSHSSGADYFIRRAGRRLLVCEKSFFEWVNMTPEQRIKASPDATRWQQKYSRK